MPCHREDRTPQGEQDAIRETGLPRGR
uniref:Orf1 n=1 Tax=Rattus sp. TaxID=10118 RepID=Q80XV7_9MURI|nr:orf1 [Rattus sp.]